MGTMIEEMMLISSDSRVNEPLDLWIDRVDKQYTDRAPRVTTEHDGRLLMSSALGLMTWHWLVAGAMAATFLLVACGGGEATATSVPKLTQTPAATPTSAPTPTQTPAATATPTAEPRRTESRSSEIIDFILEDLTVSVGTTVTWIQRDATTHTTTSGEPPSPDGIWESLPLWPGDDFSFTFNEVGTFPYYCRVHPTTMIATVTVETEDASDAPMPTPVLGVEQTTVQTAFYGVELWTGPALTGMMMQFPILPSMDQGQPVNRHLEVHIIVKNSGVKQTEIVPSVTLTDQATGLSREMAATQEAGISRNVSFVTACLISRHRRVEPHFGDNIYLPNGTYTVAVEVGDETAQAVISF